MQPTRKRTADLEHKCLPQAPLLRLLRSPGLSARAGARAEGSYSLRDMLPGALFVQISVLQDALSASEHF